jgi:hypothetical protein
LTGGLPPPGRRPTRPQNQSAGALPTYVQQSRQIISGFGLSGGGDLSADRTLIVDQQFAGFAIIPTSFSGAIPNPKFTQTTAISADTMSSLDAPVAQRGNQWATSLFSIGATDTGPINYLGSDIRKATFHYRWYAKLKVANPNLTVWVGIRFVGQTIPKAMTELFLTGAIGTTFVAQGFYPGFVVPGLQIWNGCRGNAIPANTVDVIEDFCYVNVV